MLDGHLDIVKYLIDIDIRTKNNIGNTAILSAAYESEFEVVKCLKEKALMLAKRIKMVIQCLCMQLLMTVLS